MNLDSKALPIFAALLVLGVAVLFFVGKSVLEPETATRTIPNGTQSTEPERLHPKQAEARLAIREGRLDDAKAALVSVPDTDTLYLGVLTDLAVLYESRGQHEAALLTGRKLLNLDPENGEGHHVMARSYFALQDYLQAERHALRALEIHPANGAARYTIALIRLAAGQLDRSIDAYMRAMRYGGDQASIDAALTDLTMLEEARPDLAEVHYAMAFFANSLGSEEQELLELERYLDSRSEGPAVESARQRLEALTGP